MSATELSGWDARKPTTRVADSFRKKPDKSLTKQVAHKVPFPADTAKSDSHFAFHSLSSLAKTMICAVRLAIVAILPATRSAENLFRGALSYIYNFLQRAAF